ncbi:MAG: hypothetical protein KJ792_14160 [Actinobacteria bacterium]|nr:hypothetical protein [Actinomycetota bacterium]MCG2800799.1 hypothetical protein [Cellulomonas sp.]
MGDELTTWQVDDEVLARLVADALAQAGTAEVVDRAAGRAFATHQALLEARRDLDVELALLELVHDSLEVTASAVVRSRDGSAPRSLEFRAQDGTGLEVELRDGVVEGQLIPPRAGQVTVVLGDGGTTEVDTDDVGYFRVEADLRGPVQLRFADGTGTSSTEWLTW